MILKAGPCKVHVREAKLRKGIFGDCERRPNSEHWTVRLKAGLEPGTKATTLLHELLHVIDFDYELELGEQGVCTLERALSGLIRDNPEHMVRMVQEIADAE